MPTPDPGKLFPLPKRDDAPRICVTLQIPGDQESISNFVGAVMRLALWNNYRRDDNKRAKNIAQVWKGIVRDIEFYDCNDAPNGGGGCGDGCEDMCCLRVFEGKLQSLQCGVWTTIDGGDLATIIGPSVQQPPPGGPIETGDCKEYDVTLFGSNVYNLPVSVDEGNTIQISASAGGWSDGDVVGPFGAAWSCPSGQVYALGTCGAANGPDGSDPLPSVDHMRLVVNVDGTWFDAYNTTITVPLGVSGAAVQFQANDSAIANNLGSITFHVKICATPVSTWCHKWLGGKGAVGLQLPPQTQIWGSYDYANDRIASQDSDGSFTAEYASVDIPFAGVVTNIEFDVLYDNDGPFGAAGTGIATDANNPGTQNLYQVLTPVGVGTLHVHWTGSQAIATRVRLFASSIKAVVGSTKITNIQLNGLAVSPFGADNC